MEWRDIAEYIPEISVIFTFSILVVAVIALLFGAVYFLISRIENQYKENSENIKSIRISNENIYKIVYDLKTNKQRAINNEKKSVNN